MLQWNKRHMGRTWIKSFLILFTHSQLQWGHQYNPSFHILLWGIEVLRRGAAIFKRKKHVGRWPAHCLARGFFYGVLLHSFRLQWRLSEPQLEIGPLTQKLEIPSNMYRTGSFPLWSWNIITLFYTLPAPDSSHTWGAKSLLQSVHPVLMLCYQCPSHNCAHSSPRHCKEQTHQEHHCIDRIMTEVI